MADLEYTVTNQGISTSKTSRLVSGTIGVYTVKFTFNNVWDGLEKWATFDPIPGTPYKQPLDANGECTIPGEVMGGVYLRIGVFGLAEGQAYPTIWASKLPLEEGCFVNVPPSDWPEPSPLLEDVVKVSEQTFTDAQKAQARTNIGAAGSADMATALEGKVDKPVGATEGNVAVIGSNQNIVDGGFKATASFPVGSASGSIVTIEDGANNVPVKSMTVQIQPIQAGSGDPSPSNVRAINGVTKSIVKRSEINLCGGKALMADAKRYLLGGTEYDEENNTFRFAASASNDNTGAYCLYRGMVKMPFKPNTRYTFILTIACSSTSGRNIRIYYTDGTYDTIPAVGSGNANVKMTFVMVTSAGKTVSLISKSNSGGYTTVYCDETGVFEGVLTADDFVPYNGNTYSIEFPDSAGTVYGGQLQVAEDGSGTLTVDRKGITLTKDSDWSMLSAGKFFVNNCTNNAVTGSRLAEYISNLYPFAGNGQTNSSNVSTDKRFYGQLSQNRIWVYDSSFTTLEAWETELATTPLTCVYPIATPVVYQLTAPQVCTLLGLNNIWSDTGDISVEYHADPTIYVEQKTKAIKQSLAYVQDDLTAVQPYVVNDLVYVGDTLYIVTSAISQGATMTPNTNCSETTLNAVIKSLR